MRFTPLASNILKQERVPVDVAGSSRWDVVLREARAQQDELLSALGRATVLHPSADEMHQMIPEVDANLASLPLEKQMVLARLTQFVVERSK